MKKVLLFAVMLFMGKASLYSQTDNYSNIDNDSILMEKTFLGHQYFHKGLPVSSVDDMKTIVGNNDMALKEIKRAGVVGTFSTIFASLGGAAMGWELGNAIYGKFNPYVFGCGVGVAALGFGLVAVADKHMAKGAAIYNNSLGMTSYGAPIQLDFGLVPGGVGMTLSF